MLRNTSILAATAFSVLAVGSIASAATKTESPTISGRPASASVAWNTNQEANYTVPSFNATISGPTSSASSFLLTGVPAGTYNSYTVSVDWGGSVGTAWSSEAIWALADAPLATASTFYADPGPSPVSANSTSPIHLSWTGFMDTAYTAPTSGNLYFLAAQTFGGSGATWSNIHITLGDAVVTPPASTATTLGGSLSAPLAAAGVDWYSFTYSGTGALHLDTAGSTLTASTLGDPNDTEIGLYSATGSLVGTNDDVNFTGGVLTSALDFASGALPAGTYYLAVGGFNTNFATSAFGVTSTAIQSGTIVVNGLQVVPEPASLAVAGLAGLVIRRRR